MTQTILYDIGTKVLCNYDFILHSPTCEYQLSEYSMPVEKYHYIVKTSQRLTGHVNCNVLTNTKDKDSALIIMRIQQKKWKEQM